jgi:Tol biopolymer transport system component
MKKKKIGSKKDESPAQLIDARIEELDDWRGRDAIPAPRPDQASRPRSGREVEVERGPGVVTRRTDLHRRDVQDRREADLLQGRITEGPFRPFQLEPQWQRQARNRLPRGRSDRRGRVQGVDPRGREPDRVVGPRTKGISAGELEFSRDGQWVTYVSYPDGSLWRSRADRSDRLQLTYPPVSAMLPRWSPDGSQIAFTDTQPGRPWKIFVVSNQGGTLQELLQENHNQVDPTWSADGSQIAYGLRSTESSWLRVVNLKTHQAADIPGSNNLFSPHWSPDGKSLLAMPVDSKKLLLYDFDTKKWSEWFHDTGTIGFPMWSPDGRFVYFDSVLSEHPGYRRVKLGQSTSEFLLDFRQLRRYQRSIVNPWSAVAPDGSILGARDVSTDEIYALDLELP